MPIIKYNQLNDYLASPSASPGPRVFLICGETFLVREAFDTLSSFLLREVNRKFALDLLDGTSASMGEIIEQTTTFSFLLTRKVIAVKNAPLFLTAASEISYSPADLDLLTALVEKGIPDMHTLVLTSTTLDKRKKVFKTLKTHGMIIDCVVSQGAARADLEEQKLVLQDIARNLLAATKKRMDTAALNALVDQTGFNPDLFARNIEKLAAYTGSSPVIGIGDIQAVVIRDKKDPIFSLTNAVLEKDAARALLVLSSLFSEGFHPLQILKSFENQVRKLLMIKAVIPSLSKDSYAFKRMNFNRFKQEMMPLILAHDEKIKKEVAFRDHSLSLEKTSGKEKAVSAELMLAPNPQSPYPVFLMFQKSENFSLDSLKDAMIALGDLDYQLKTSPIEAHIGIENFIITICRKGGSSHATENKDSCHHL
ncbi:MAG: DNA polymerase III subunit delta [Proteobacteria bacterium]|nr:DNA polymerase III subunit delta [Pseudomonadota bacterium]MBU4130145.1 DNA polymerase III subunit delta [Pseudomonadota bacterium]